MNDLTKSFASDRKAEGKRWKSVLRALSSFHGQRGVVLIAVLWCCAIIMWFALQISAQTRLLGEDQLHAIRASHALYLAVGGCYEALARMEQPHAMQTDLPAAQNWQPDGRPRVVAYQTGVAVVIMEPAEQKVNVNMVQESQLEQVLQRAGAGESASKVLANRIIEFVHPDNMSQLQGMGKTDYTKGGLGYAPFNGPLTSLDQLLLVPGVSQQLFYGYNRGIDESMREAPKIFKDIVIPAQNSLFSLLTIYGNNVNLQDDSEDQQGFAPKSTSWKPGGIYRILSFGKSANGPPSVGIWLTVRYTGGADRPYQVLSRKVM